MEVLLNILLFAVANAFLIGLLLVINKKGNLRANRYYGLLTWALSAVALENILISSGGIFKIPHLFTAGSIMMLLVPPFGYLLYQQLMEPSRKTPLIVVFLHLLPFLLCALSLIPLFRLSGEIKSEIIQNIYYEHQEIRGFGLLYSATNILQFIIYNIFIAKRLKQNRLVKSRKTQRLGISWMSALLLTMNGIIGAYLALYLSFIYTTEFQPVLMVLFIAVMLATIYLTGYQLVQNPFYFSTHQAAYQRSTLNKQLEKELSTNLNLLLANDRPYLKPGTKLNEIADKLNVTHHQLSQFLNQTKASTFTEFMNAFRVKHAQEMLKRDKQKQQTILAIALESGFSNQANFIKVFKESTGLTPSEYRKKGA